MLGVQNGRHARSMRIAQWTTFACLCLGAVGVSSMGAPAEKARAESEALASGARNEAARSVDGNADLAAEGITTNSEELPPLPTSATYKTWVFFGSDRVSLHRGMVLGRNQTRMELPGQVIINDRGKSLTLNLRDKNAYITKHAEGSEEADFFGHLRKLLTEPQYLPDMKREMLGESEIGGRRAVAYRITEPSKIRRIWVDPDSLLPIQVESVYKIYNHKSIMTDFVFNEDLEKALFSLDPPADYSVVVRTASKESTLSEENDLVEMFRQYRENGQDTFPDAVDALAALGLQTMEFDLRKKLTEERRQEISEFAKKVGRGPEFVAGLPAEADAHYAGKGVKLDATDTPIFWYRPEGKGKYRVIRGDLSVVEVDSPPEIPGAQAIDDWGKNEFASQRPWPHPGARYDVRPFKEGVRAGGELKYVNDIPVLFLHGTPEEMGRQQGLLLADAARPLIDLPKDLAKEAGFDAAWPVIVLLCKAGLERAPQQYRRELEAAIQAAGLTEEERDALIVVNVMAELQGFGGCSSLVVEPSRSATGEMVFGRNFDYRPRRELDRFGIVTVYRPNGKHAFASVGFPGFGGVLSGTNDAGLALAIHAVGVSRENESPFNPLGTPLYCTFRRVLEECSSVEEAEELLRMSKGYIKPILLVACDAKRAAVFEITTKKVVTRDPEDHLLICTNHFRSPELCRSKECPRYAALARLWPQEGPLDCSDVTQSMRLVGGMTTIQSMIFEPRSMRLRVALGMLPLWEGPFAAIDLTTLFRHQVPEY